MSSHYRRRSNNAPRGNRAYSQNQNQIPDQMAQSSGVPQRLRNDEISSQTSSSSLSSIENGEPNEIVTTGLRVSQTPNHGRRRRTIGGRMVSERERVNTSSQEEYEESESEEDPNVMTSSNEHDHILPVPTSSLAVLGTGGQRGGNEYHPSEEENEEEGTALGTGYTNTHTTSHQNQQQFTPQPNAFSHPPRPLSSRSSTAQQPYTTSSRPGYQTQAHNRRSSSYQEGIGVGDHNAALRASLTTLLSCAAAARGLVKVHTSGGRSANEGLGPMPGVGRSNALPMAAVRMVPESELIGDSNPPRSSEKGKEKERDSRRSNFQEQEREKDKRKEEKPLTGKRKTSLPTTTNTSSESQPEKKKKRTASQQSPSAGISGFSSYDNGGTGIGAGLLTWVVSAGVVVLVSVVGFGAYVIGREVGRNEGLGSTNFATAGGGGGNSTVNGAGLVNAGVVQGGGGGSCGREVVKGTAGGLRRLQWGVAGGGGRSGLVA